MVQNNMVTLDSAVGKVRRVLVQDLGDVVLVCRPEEYVQAKEEGREPVTAAFPKKDVVAEGN